MIIKNVPFTIDDVQMDQKNELVSLRNKFWKDQVQPHPDVECPEAKKKDEISDAALKPENMIGVFLVIGT